MVKIVCQKLNRTIKIKNPEETDENIMQEANELKDNKTEENEEQQNSENMDDSGNN